MKGIVVLKPSYLDKISEQFAQELNEERLSKSRFIHRKARFKTLKAASKKKRESVGFSFPSFERLESAYRSLAVYLNHYYINSSARTPFEIQIQKKIERATKLKVYSSMWIGNRNVDLFFPQVKEKNSSFKGIAFEIDGPIHDHSLKMKKDNLKDDLLLDLKIVTVRIDNCDLNHNLVSKIIKNLKNLSRLDSRGRKRVLVEVYTETLLFYENDNNLEKLFLNR